MNDHIAIGADHGGFELKREIIAILQKRGLQVTDLGAHSAEASDYPDFARQAAQGIASGAFDRAILVCGTGVGMAIVANRYPGVRAVNCSDIFTARSSRSHNNANVLALGARVVGPGLAWEIIDAWLATPFSTDGRHVRRVGKIDAT